MSEPTLQPKDKRWLSRLRKANFVLMPLHWRLHLTVHFLKGFAFLLASLWTTGKLGSATWGPIFKAHDRYVSAQVSARVQFEDDK